jgi:drug/metabolite transporter (DMT)-like permease
VPFPYAGEICALVAPLCWSVAIMLYRRAGEHASPMALTMFKNTFATVLLGLTMWTLGISFPRDRLPTEWLRLTGSGVLGLAVADTLLFEALRRVGAARVAVVDTIYAPLVVLLSCLFRGERLSSAFLLGGTVVVLGVIVANRPKADDHGKPVPFVGLLCGFGAVSGTAVGVILAKPVLEHSNLVEVTFTRLFAGVAAQLVFALARRTAGEMFAAFYTPGIWRTLAPAAFVGTYLSLLFWLGGFKWANASVAAVLNQMATVYILVLARLVLHEKVGKTQIAGGALAAVGAVLVLLGR